MNPIKPICTLLFALVFFSYGIAAQPPEAEGTKLKNSTVITDTDIQRSTGKSETITIDPTDKVVSSPKSTKERFMEQLLHNAMQAQFEIRIADCIDRANFAGVVPQLLAQGKTADEIHKKTEDAFNSESARMMKERGEALPPWYKLEFHRIVNDAVRMKATDPKKFAVWVAEQCVEFGPWLNPEAK